MGFRSISIERYRFVRPKRTSTKGVEMPNYALVYGEDDDVRRETLVGVTVEREDGWLTIFRGKDSILRVREEHVRSIEEVN